MTCNLSQLSQFQPITIVLIWDAPDLKFRPFLDFTDIFSNEFLQANTTKGNPAEVEIIRYQALIPVGEVQVKAGAIVDSDGHYTWELIQLKTSANRTREKSYHLSNR